MMGGKILESIIQVFFIYRLASSVKYSNKSPYIWASSLLLPLPSYPHSYSTFSIQLFSNSTKEPLKTGERNEENLVKYFVSTITESKKIRSYPHVYLSQCQIFYVVCAPDSYLDLGKCWKCLPVAFHFSILHVGRHSPHSTSLPAITTYDLRNTQFHQHYSYESLQRIILLFI